MKKMKRVILIVVDGAGIGEMKDAEKYGDKGADTLGHVLEQKHPKLPNLTALGLGNIRGWKEYSDEEPIGCYGKAAEKSAGKDTTTGHWEIACLPMDKPFPTYPNGFPKEIIDKFEDATGMKVIGNKPASGTEIIEELGPEQLRTGSLIVYTSADSVFQIAAHEAVIPVLTLWDYCRQARRILTGEHAVGRVIARPYSGMPGSFERTGNRRDFSVDPIGPTMLDVLRDDGKQVIGIGKIEDIFNHKGLTQSDHAVGNVACIDSVLDFLKKKYWNGLMFVNLVDTDSKYGHRNDVQGFAESLEDFDECLGDIIPMLGEDDLLIITADHGCDPAYPTTDHTREYVPVLVWGLGINEGVDLGELDSFADIGKTVMEALGVNNKLPGESFYSKLVD